MPVAFENLYLYKQYNSIRLYFIFLDEKNIEKSIRSTEMFLKGMKIGFRPCTGKALLVTLEGLECIIYVILL